MAMEFNGIGSGQHVDLGTLDLPSGLSALSIFSWCQFNSFTVQDQRIISKATSSAAAAHWFMFSSISTSQMRVRLKTGGTTQTHIETSAAITLNQWYHMGFVYNGANVLIYRDGVQTTSAAQTGTVDTSASTEVRIADNPGPDRLELDGFVDDIRIYDRALSAGEVQTIHATSGRDDIVDGLLHRWRLDEGSAGVAASGAGIHKDLTGAVNGTPAASPVFRESILGYRRAA